jgi:hypothetical protein
MSEHSENAGVPLPNGNRGGIMEPMYQYRFRVIFMCDIGCAVDGEQDLIIDTVLTRNITYVKTDFLKKYIEIGIRQPLHGSDVMNKIWEVVQTKKQEIYLDALNGKNTPTMTMTVHGSRVVEHSFTLSYGDEGFVEHKLLFEFDGITTHSKCVWEKQLERWFEEKNTSHVDDSTVMSPKEALASISTDIFYHM